jgi:hypothetical protein
LNKNNNNLIAFKDFKKSSAKDSKNAERLDKKIEKNNDKLYL